MSGAKQTLLIDIHSFRTVHKWTDERFLELFKIMFDHPKKIYGLFELRCEMGKDVLGFDFTNDMKIIGFNFPLFERELLPKLTNLVCIYSATKIVSWATCLN